MSVGSASLWTDLEVSEALGGNMTRDPDGRSSVGDSPRELRDMSGLADADRQRTGQRVFHDITGDRVLVDQAYLVLARESELVI